MKKKRNNHKTRKSPWKFIYIVCPEGTQSCNTKNTDIYWRGYKIQETLYIGQWCPHPLQSRHHRISQFSQLLPATLSYFPESFWQSEISSLSKVIFIWGKARSLGAPNVDCSGAELSGWHDVLPKNSAWDVMHEQACCCDEAASHQLPVAAAFWTIGIASTEECSNLTENLMRIRCSTRSVTLNATVTQYTRSLNSIYCPHWLVQWSHLCSHVCIPVHSPWLPGYISVVQTILIILTMAGLFLDRPHVCVCVCVCVCFKNNRCLKHKNNYVLKIIECFQVKKISWRVKKKMMR